MEHRLYVEEFVCNLRDEELTDNDDGYNRPETLTHFQFEYALACLEATGVEHIPEVRPDEYGEQQGGLVWRHWVLSTDNGMEHLRNGCNLCMIEEPIKSEGDCKEDKSNTAKLPKHRLGKD